MRKISTPLNNQNLCTVKNNYLLWQHRNCQQDYCLRKPNDATRQISLTR